MNSLNVIAFVFLLLEMFYLAIVILASKFPYFRDTRRRLARSITASVFAQWVYLISWLVMVILAIHFLTSFWAVMSTKPFKKDTTGKKFDAHRAGRLFEERNTYLSGFVLVLFGVILKASFERGVIEERREESEQESDIRVEEDMAQTPMVGIRVRRIP